MLEKKNLFIHDRFRLFMLLTFGLIGVLAGIDVLADIKEGMDIDHIVAESVVFVIAISSSTVIFIKLVNENRAARKLVADLTRDLNKNREQALEWRNETKTLLRGLGASINNQFERWELTPSEKEIALLLLKGLSHKEVAYIRGVSEATARQQARAVYKKGGLAGRHDLAAFFLEELALPLSETRV